MRFHIWKLMEMIIIDLCWLIVFTAFWFRSFLLALNKDIWVCKCWIELKIKELNLTHFIWRLLFFFFPNARKINFLYLNFEFFFWKWFRWSSFICLFRWRIFSSQQLIIGIKIRICNCMSKFFQGSVNSMDKSLLVH